MPHRWVGLHAPVAALLAAAATAHAAPPSSPPPAPRATPPPDLPPGDAERMRELPVGAGTFRPGRGLEVASADGRFSLNLSLWAQILYTLRDEPAAADHPAALTNALELRRARVVLTGKLFSPHFAYHAHLMFAPRDLAVKDGIPRRAPLFQWFGAFTRLRHANIQAGFFFVPYARQRMQPIPRLQMVDNSSASYEFTLDQDIGVQVSSPDVAGLGKLRYYAGVFMGEGYEWYRASDLGLTYVGRVDLLPFGLFDDYSEVDHDRTWRPRLAIGAGYGYSDRDRRTRAIAGAAFADGGSMRSHNLTADLVFKIGGLSLLLDVYYRQGHRLPGGAVDDLGALVPVQAARNGFGWTAQLGHFIPRTRLEGSARWSSVRAARRLGSSLQDLDEVGAGVGYYFLRHALKLQADYFHTFGPGVATGTAEQLRVQLQVSL